MAKSIIDADIFHTAFVSHLNQTLRATKCGPIERSGFVEEGIRAALFETVKGFAQAIIDEKRHR